MVPADQAGGGRCNGFRGSPYTLGPLIPVGASPVHTPPFRPSIYTRLLPQKDGRKDTLYQLVLPVVVQGSSRTGKIR